MAARIAAIFDQSRRQHARLIEYRWERLRGCLPACCASTRDATRFTVQTKRPLTLRESERRGLACTNLTPTKPDLRHPGDCPTETALRRARPRHAPRKQFPEASSARRTLRGGADVLRGRELASLLHRYARRRSSRECSRCDRHVGKWACAIQVPILAYLLREDPAAAKPRIEAAVAARGPQFSACNHSVLTQVGALQQNSLLEEIAIPSLNDDDPEVAANAASFLGAYGSAADEEKSGDVYVGEEWRAGGTFRTCRGENLIWRGSLSRTYSGSARKIWLADAGKLHRLRQLALGADMRQRVENMLTGWEKGRPTIAYSRGGDRPRFRVLQYEANSLKSFQEKLAQFPAGTEFNWGGGGAASDEDEQVRQELSEFLESRGMKLSKPQN